MKTVHYSEIKLFGDNSCFYNGDIYTTKENLQLFPEFVTLKQNISSLLRKRENKAKKERELKRCSNCENGIFNEQICSSIDKISSEYYCTKQQKIVDEENEKYYCPYFEIEEN